MARNYPRRFQLVREFPVPPSIATGIIAFGVLFPDDVAVLRWRAEDEPAETTIWNHIDAIRGKFCLDGNTRLEWID